jgi:hypothetical protein
MSLKTPPITYKLRVQESVDHLPRDDQSRIVLRCAFDFENEIFVEQILIAEATNWILIEMELSI